MRIRSVHPPFWSDKIMGKLSDSTRLIFIGIWMLSDDAGWSDWDPEQMATELFPWQPVKAREARFGRAAEELRLAGRIVIHDCAHAQVPSLHVYQKPGRPYYAIRDAHERHCAQRKPLRGSKQGLAAISTDSVSEGKGSEVKGRETRARARGSSSDPEGPTRLGDLMPGVREKLSGQ